MPRISPAISKRAKRTSAHIAALLPACRDLASAHTELRWIKNNLLESFGYVHPHHLSRLCRLRAVRQPLQYILGSQPFGNLDIGCRRGVLIPRPETEAYTFHLADLIKTGKLLAQNHNASSTTLRIIDFCTGTGCIPLGLFSSLSSSKHNLDILGVDISSNAVKLARENILRNVKSGILRRLSAEQSISFTRGDIFDENCIKDLQATPWDLITANPPYISDDVWKHGRGQLGYSVRKFEPRLALVPEAIAAKRFVCKREDIFYSRLLDISTLLRPKAMLLEVGDQDQAQRVLSLIAGKVPFTTSRIEIWRDWPDASPGPDEDTQITISEPPQADATYPVIGSGNIRALLLRNEASTEL